jgi:hypothetical protein
LTARKAQFVYEKSVNSPEMPPRSPAAWVFPDEMSEVKNCVRCNGGFNTLSEEIIVRFIPLCFPFDHTQSHVSGGKVGHVT